MAKATITIDGYVRTSELKFTNTGTAVYKIKVPVDRRKKDQNTGQWETVNTTWWEVTYWAEEAEHVAERIKDGDHVTVTGMPELSKSTSKDGKEFVSPVITYPSVAVVQELPRENRGGQSGPSNVNGQGGFGQPQQQAQRPGPNDPWSGGQPANGAYNWGQAQGQVAEPPF